VCQQSISKSTKFAKLTNFEFLDIWGKIKKHGRARRIHLSHTNINFRTRIFQQLLTRLSMPGFDSSLRIKKRVTKNEIDLACPKFSSILSLLSVIIRKINHSSFSWKINDVQLKYVYFLEMLGPELMCWNDLFYVKFTTDLLNLGRLRYIHSVCLWYPYVIIILSYQATGPRRTYFLVEN